MNQYRGGAGGGASSSAEGGAGAGGPGRPLTGDALRKATNLALRQIKKLRKYELEQVCKIAGLSTTGLKATLLGNIESYIGSQYSLIARSGLGAGASHARVLTAMTQEISRGFSNVLHKRPVAGGPYSQLKQDGGPSHVASSKIGGGAVGGGGAGAGGGGIRWDDQAVNDVLRRSELDPFVQVKRTLSGPARFERGSGSQNVSMLRFDLGDDDHAAVRLSLSLEKRTEEGRKTHVLLRSYKLTSGALQGPEAEAAKASEGAHVWPLESACQVNGAYQPLKQRKVFFQGQTRKLKGDCSPQDIGASCRLGENRIEVYSTDPDPHAVLVQMVRLVGVEEVLNNVKERSKLTEKEALRRVKRSFKGSLDLNSHLGGESSEEEDAGKGGEEDSDDDLMATATRLSLRCPLGLVPITCPGRGRNCKHLQCFDLTTFLNYNKDCAGAAWKCGVCNLPIKPADLVVDTYLNEVVLSLEERGLTDDAEEVEIHQDGHWEPILGDQKAGVMSRRDRKRLKAESAAAAAGAAENGGGNNDGGGGGGGNTVDLDGDDPMESSGSRNGSAASPAGAPAAAPPPPPAPAPPAANEPEVFDLCSTDDEDDDEPLPSTLAPAAASVSSTAPAASPSAAPQANSNGGGGGGGVGGGAGAVAGAPLSSSSSSAAAGLSASVGGAGNSRVPNGESSSSAASRFERAGRRGDPIAGAAVLQASDAAWRRTGDGMADLSLGGSEGRGGGGRGLDWLSGGGRGRGGGGRAGVGGQQQQQQRGESSAQQHSQGGVGGGSSPSRLWQGSPSFGPSSSSSSAAAAAAAAAARGGGAGAIVISGEEAGEDQQPQPWYPGASTVRAAPTSAAAAVVGSPIAARRQQQQQRPLPPSVHNGGGIGGSGGAGGRAREGGYPRPLLPAPPPPPPPPPSSTMLFGSGSARGGALLAAPVAGGTGAGRSGSGGPTMTGMTNGWKDLGPMGKSVAAAGAAGAAAGGGGGGAAAPATAVVGWDAVAMGASGRPAVHSLKRPRPGSSPPDDYPARQQPPSHARRPSGGSGSGRGGVMSSFRGSLFGSSSSSSSSSRRGAAGGLPEGIGGRWGGSGAAGGGAGVGGRGRGLGGGGGAPGDAAAAAAAAAASAAEASVGGGGGGGAGGWDDEVFRNLDGLGDPLGR